MADDASTTVLGLVQMGCTDNVQQNVSRAKDLVRKAAKEGAQVVVLPELFRTKYFCQSEDHDQFALAERIPGPTTEILAKLAADLRIVIVAGLFEKRAEGIFHNAAAVLDADGRLLGKYRKMHIPDDPLYYEKFYFTPGDLGFQVFATRFGRLGVLICWDQWFPEAARLTALRGADILLYPTAIGWHPEEKQLYGPSQHESWELIQRSHAVANGCFVAAVNRTGHEGEPGGGIEFWGQSFVSGPDGQVLGCAASEGEEVLVVPIDLSRVEQARTHWPFLRDRRIDAYGQLTQRFIDQDEPQ